jgi:hypothetical protein
VLKQATTQDVRNDGERPSRYSGQPRPVREILRVPPQPDYYERNLTRRYTALLAGWRSTGAYTGENERAEGALVYQDLPGKRGREILVTPFEEGLAGWCASELRYRSPQFPMMYVMRSTQSRVYGGWSM